MCSRPTPFSLATLPRVALFCVALFWTGIGHAQAPGNRLMPDRSGLVAVEVYEEAASRQLFMSADRNADDRLDLIEASQSLQTVDGIRDRAGFRRLDRDRNGYLGWPEFDAHLQSVLRSNEIFYLAPSRPMLLQDTPPAAVRPAADQSMMGLLDRDHNGTLSREEVQVLLSAAGLRPELIEQYPLLDTDRSGALSATEAAPLANLLPMLIAGRPRPADDLPEVYRGADRNGDGHLDRLELDLCLRLLDPGLGRWTDKVLMDADPDRSGTLDQRELQRAGDR